MSGSGLSEAVDDDDKQWPGAVGRREPQLVPRGGVGAPRGQQLGLRRLPRPARHVQARRALLLEIVFHHFVIDSTYYLTF